MGFFDGIMSRIGYTRYRDGSHWYNILKNNTTYIDGKDKLKISLEHSIISSLISIRSNYLSRVKFYVEDANGEKDFDDPSLDFIKNPNPHQSTEDFLKQYEWFLCSYGWVYQRPYNSIVKGQPKFLYNLNSSKIEFPKKLGDTIINTRADERKYYSNEFIYQDVETRKKYSFSDVIIFFDSTNSIDNCETSAVTSPSRLDSIIKEASNTSLATDAENVIIQTNGREMIFNEGTGANLGSSLPMKSEDKENIQTVLNNKHLTTKGSRTLTPSQKLGWVNMTVKLADLGYNDSRQINSNILGQRYQVPNEIYKAFTSGDTFENQKQAEVKFIQNVIQPRANDLAGSWTSAFGDPNKPYKSSFDHLPSMQESEDTRAEKALKISTAYRNLIQSGLEESQAKEFMSNLGIEMEA